MTVKEIITKYLEEKLLGRSEVTLASSNFQSILADYAKDKFNIIHSPETYIRAWRDFKNTTKDYKIIKVKLPIKTKQQYYKICRNIEN